MKKIVTAVAAIAMAASMFAVDFSATVQVKGDIAYGNSDQYDAPSADNGWAGAGHEAKNKFGLFGVESTNQKDNDLLEVHFAGDKAGADFKLWADAKEDGGKLGDGKDALQLRALDVWFSPIDQVKIKLGSVSQDMYKERLNWWKVPCGANLKDFKSWNHRWSGYTTVEGFGATVDVNLDVLNGLYIGAGVLAGDNWIVSQNDVDNNGKAITSKVYPNGSYGAYGVMAKLNVMDGLSVGAAWRDEGYLNPKIITVGADYSAGSFYGMVQARMLISNVFSSQAEAIAAEDAKLAIEKQKGKLAFTGITIDNYFSYNFGFMSVDGTLPVTIRGFVDNYTKDSADKVYDPIYMTARVRVSFPMDAFKFNVVLGTDEGTNNGPAGSTSNLAWTLDENFAKTFNFYVNPSVDFNVGVCALNVGLEFAIDCNTKEAWSGDKNVYNNIAWAVPFTAKVAF